MMTVKQLEDLKAKIEQKKIQKSRLEGQLSQLLVTMKDEYDCKSVEELEGKLKELQEQKIKMERRVSESTKELENSIDWSII